MPRVETMKLLNQAVVTTLPFIPRPLVRFFAGRYIAGETLESAVRLVADLNAKKAMATIDVLGEDITRKEEALEARIEAGETLKAIASGRLDSNISVKLTQFGLKLDTEFCYTNVRDLVVLAGSLNNFVRIDMEDHTCTDDTLGIFSRLRSEFTNVGIVVQAYLKRTESDVRELLKLGATFRLCKGIYIEPPEIAFRDRRAVQENYLSLLDLMFSQKAYVGIATHDSVLIDGAKKLITKHGLSRSDYEFQMLYGVRNDLRDSLLAEGHRLRIYVPYGEHWYKYSIRRFKENPEVAGYVVKALFDFLKINGRN